ncbi:uncharacterized protein LJ206_012524 isoform 2-T2 [Theristicus caerulescens]
MQDSIPQRKGALHRPLGYPRTPETLVHTGSGRVVSSERYVDVLERQKRARENMEACFWSFNHPTTCCVLHIGSSTSKKPSARIADQVHGMIQLEKNSEYH